MPEACCWGRCWRAAPRDPPKAPRLSLKPVPIQVVAQKPPSTAVPCLQEVEFQPLPKPSPVSVPMCLEEDCALNGSGLPVVAFYCPGNGLTEWDRRTGGAPFGNFWPLAPHTITVTHSGVSGTFANSEAAYQAFKWWQHAETRRRFEQCDAPDLGGGGQAYLVKKACEKERPQELEKYFRSDFDGLGKYGAMLHTLRAKWRLPGFKEQLLESAGVFLVEHCEVQGRDPYWTDDYDGGGQNRLGAALMEVRAELLGEAGAATDGWPLGVHRPQFAGGGPNSNWQSVVRTVAEYLVSETREAPLTAPAPPAPKVEEDRAATPASPWSRAATPFSPTRRTSKGWSS